jgi:hypothetical protein
LLCSSVLLAHCRYYINLLAIWRCGNLIGSCLNSLCLWYRLSINNCLTIRRLSSLYWNCSLSCRKLLSLGVCSISWRASRNIHGSLISLNNLILTTGSNLSSYSLCCLTCLNWYDGCSLSSLWALNIPIYCSLSLIWWYITWLGC